jgi:hypothetical protein
MAIFLYTSNILHVGQVETAHFCNHCYKLFLRFLKATDVGVCSYSGIQDLNFWHLLFLQVAQEINSEAKFQNDFLNQLVMFSAISYLRLLWLLGLYLGILFVMSCLSLLVRVPFTFFI